MVEEKPGSPIGADDLRDSLALAQRAILAGDNQTGRRLLIRLLEQDQRNEDAWLWLSAVVTSERERQVCLRNVLRINPQNKIAIERLRLINQRGAARQRVSQRQAQIRSIQAHATGGVLALALFVIVLYYLLGINEKLAGQPVALIPLYTRAAFTVRSRDTSPLQIATATTTALPTMPEPAVALPSTEMPTPKEIEVEDSERAHQFVVPVNGEVSVGFSRVHPALDFDAPTGTLVVASEGGSVLFAGWNSRGYGNLVVINHATGWQSWYAHLESISVGAGDGVCRACPIGTVGDTGFSSRSHLHFEIRNGCTFYDLFTGERLDSGIAESYRYDPFGAPICQAAATASPSAEGP